MRVIVFNIHAGTDAHRDPSLDAMGELISSERPDIVLLQEVDRRTQRSGVVDQVATLARLTGMNGIFGKTLDYQGGEYGIGLLTPWPVTSDSMVPLPVRPLQERAGGSYEPRGALIVTIEMPSGPLMAINTHLHASLDDAYRMQEVATLRRLADSLSADHAVVVGGDFNSLPDSRVVDYMRETEWQDAWTQCGAGAGFTFPVDIPSRRIDYLFLEPGMQCTQARVPANLASDHRPVVIDVIP